MTVDQARKKIIDGIDVVYQADEAKNIAELLLEHVTKRPLTERIIKKGESMSADQEELLFESIKRLQHHEPIQYITSESWFGGMKFYIDMNVLIPRPETEELVEWIIEDVKREALNVKKILDVGTGSGCIAVALKTKLPNIEMWACDVSDEALNVARLNADALNAAIDFIPLDFLDAHQRQQLPRVDVIVSNPPYVPDRGKNGMRKNVIDYEPSIALFVPNDDALIFYNSIADFGKEKLHQGGCIYVEIHEDLGDKVQNVFRSKGYNSIEMKKDLQGKDRMIKALIGF